MGRKRTILAWLVCMFLLLTGQNVLASGSGVVPKPNGGTSVLAGVAVEYMRKLQFHVVDRDTKNPIEGASVEIYIPSLGRYVLFGVTDANGILELDVVYGDRTGQFVESGGQTIFVGSALYLLDDSLTYQVYKAGWRPYPHKGVEALDRQKDKQIITVELHKDKGGGGGGGGGGSSSGGDTTETIAAFPIEDMLVPIGGLTTDPTDQEDGQKIAGIPKTGVEGTMIYWLIGLLFFLAAGGLIGFLMWSEKSKKRQNK